MSLGRRLASLTVTLLVFTVGGHAGESNGSGDEVPCTVDLTDADQLSDIISNALIRGLGKKEERVRSFLDAAADRDESADTLLAATTKAFELDEAILTGALEKYRHANCTHAGGERYREADTVVSEFAENVVFHVVLHELGHALVREFDLPVLANEETLADAFATYYAVTELPSRALAILEARVESQMIEANEIARGQWTVRGEHNSDARRAYQVAAIAIAHDAEKYAPLADLVEMTRSQMRGATDYGSEIHRSWRRLLAPLKMPPGQRSKEARVVIDDESVFAESIRKSELVEELRRIVGSFDWHSQVTIRFTGGDGGAAWSRSRRTITVHDQYIQRFNSQSGRRLQQGSS